MSLNRRDWLKTSTLAAGAGLLLGREAAAAIPVPVPAGLRPRALDGKIRLHLNENPYGPSPKAREALVAHMDEANKYGPAGTPLLRDLIAATWNVPADHVLVTQGSGEGLAAAGAAFGLGGGEVVTAQPTFDSLVKYAESVGATIVNVPLDAQLRHDLPAMQAKVGARTKLVYVCNPHNPTGTIVSGAALADFCRAVSPTAPVFVDEAYNDFVDDPGYASMLPLVREGANVVVARTASKIHGMAGLRVGFIVAKPALLERVRKYVMGFPNALAVRAAFAAVQDVEYQRYIKAQNAAARAIAVRAIREAGLEPVPSHTNFVFFRTGKPIAQVAKAFEAQGILVGRPFPPYLDWCRVSMGTPEEMRRFAAALKGAIA